MSDQQSDKMTGRLGEDGAQEKELEKEPEKEPERESEKEPEEKPDKEPKPAPARTKKQKIIMIVMIVLAVVMVIAAALVLLYNRWVKKPPLPPAPGESSAPAVQSGSPADPSAEPTLGFDAVQPKVSGERISKDIYTIFVFGSDVISGCTDTMMVVTYDVTNQKAAVMSLPRDTLVNVRRYDKSLNAVYNAYQDSAQGLDALKNEVSELVGFMPDYYVKVDWELVGEMVDAIGGVWYDVPFLMDYIDPAQDLYIYQVPGYRKISGGDAMQIVRWRHNNTGSPDPGDGSDLYRLKMQHNFLKAVLKQTLQIQNVTRIGQLSELFGNRVESDLTVENLFWFASQAIFGGLEVDDVEFCTMPCYGVYQGRFKWRVYPNQTELLKLINEKLNPFVEQVTIRQLDLIQVSDDGNTLSSSTGVLADPSAGYYLPPSAEPSLLPSSDPPESDPPVESVPIESGPVESEPPESAPPESDPPAQPSREPEPSETPDRSGTPD